MPKPKKTYQEIKGEMLSELESLVYTGQHRDVAMVLLKFKDKMIERAEADLDAKTLHYIEVGKAAEAFFGSMKLNGKA